MSLRSPLIVSVAGILLLLLVVSIMAFRVRGIKRVLPENDVDLENAKTPSKDQIYRARLKEKQEQGQIEQQKQEVERLKQAQEEREQREKGKEELQMLSTKVAVLEAERSQRTKEAAALVQARNRRAAAAEVDSGRHLSNSSEGAVGRGGRQGVR